MISCKNISALVNGEAIFSDISFTLQPAECLIIKGSNGAGKTTLLKTLLGLHDLASGEVLLWNNSPNNLPTEHKKLIAYIGHKNAIFEELTVYENLEFWAGMFGVKEAILAALSYFDIENIYDHKAKSLSAGEKRKLALSRLLCCDSLLWILDEPATNLDSDSIKKLENLINTKLQNGGTVILTSHQNLNIQNHKVLELV